MKRIAVFVRQKVIWKDYIVNVLIIFQFKVLKFQVEPDASNTAVLLIKKEKKLIWV